MVVPVDVALGRGTPRAWRARLRLWFEKSKPGILLACVVCWYGCLDGYYFSGFCDSRECVEMACSLK